MTDDLKDLLTQIDWCIHNNEAGFIALHKRIKDLEDRVAMIEEEGRQREQPKPKYCPNCGDTYIGEHTCNSWRIQPWRIAK